jgi:hypothetical protein
MAQTSIHRHTVLPECPNRIVLYSAEFDELLAPQKVKAKVGQTIH